MPIHNQINKLTRRQKLICKGTKQPILVQGEVRQRRRSAMEEEPRDGCLLLTQRTRLDSTYVRPSAPPHQPERQCDTNKCTAHIPLQKKREQYMAEKRE